MSVIDDIKNRLDILDVVSGYVSLQRSGRNHKACCPFHQERTPSFYVDQTRQSWRCFGACATGGDIFGFIMRAESLEFRDALQRLAQQAGVTLPSPERRSEQEGLFGLNEAVREYFQQYLASSMGADARSYLEQRGISKESISRFELGLSPRDGQGLFNHLARNGFTAEQMVRAGAVHLNQDGGHRDAFRGRLMIPIRNEQGELAGFGSRALDDSLPKYLNTGRTAVFDKSRILYGLNLARESVRNKGIVIVEGYMDAITAHQHGFDNVVASMGTALTAQQVAQVRRLTQDVIMALDADAAGQQATLRSLESSWQVFQNRQVAQAGGTSIFQRQENLNLRVAVLADGKDPDEVIRHSPERWSELLEQAVPLFDYLLPAVTSQIDATTPEGKARVVEVVRPFIYADKEPIRQDSYVRKLADHLSVREETLQATLKGSNGQNGGNRAAPRNRPGNDNRFVPSNGTSTGPSAGPWPGSVDSRSNAPAGGRQGNGIDVSAFAAEDRDPVEEYFLAFLLTYPEVAADLDGLEGRIAEYFKRPENREIYSQLLRALEEMPEMLLPEDNPAERLKTRLMPELGDQLANLLAVRIPATEPWARQDELRKSLGKLEQRFLKDMKQAEQARFSEDLSAIPEEALPETLDLNRQIKANQETRKQSVQNAVRGR